MNLRIFVLLDTNIVLDYTLQRGKHYENARKIFALMGEDKIIAHISASQVTDIYYFLEKELSREQAMAMIADLVAAIRVIRVDEDTINDTLASGMADFEDAVQTEAAKAMGIDIVVTRDKAGFADSGLSVFEPEGFVSQIS